MNTPKHRGPFQIIGSREVYKNPWIAVREDSVIIPGGKQGIFGIVEMKAGSTVLALSEDNYVYLVKEYKYGIGEETLELVSGGISGEKEDPLITAKRELREELGFEAREWISFGYVNPFTTVINSPNYMFLARGLSTTGLQNLDDGELLDVIKVPFFEALQMVIDSRITHSASCVLILKANSYLQGKI